MEITKLVVAALTPVAVAVLGLWLNRYLKRLEHLQWGSQKVIEKRLEVYSKLSPVLNDIYCYLDYIGDWKYKDPVSVLSLKRCADREFYVNAPLFSQSFRDAYHAFINLCFIPGPLEEYDASAKLKTDIAIRRDISANRGQQWNAAWDSYFAPPDEVTKRDNLLQGYWSMMDTFARELGVELRNGWEPLERATPLRGVSRLSPKRWRSRDMEAQVPKSTTCILSGQQIDIQAALEIRERKSSADFRCPECGERVRAHKKSTTGQEAHFEHLSSNSRCSLSGQR